MFHAGVYKRSERAKPESSLLVVYIIVSLLNPFSELQLHTPKPRSEHIYACNVLQLYYNYGIII